jgi:hypothetical protein
MTAAITGEVIAVRTPQMQPIIAPGPASPLAMPPSS